MSPPSAPPTNTLLITNLQDPSIFHPTSLITIRDSINNAAPLHSFSPLKSFRRIICSFYDTDSAIRIRQLLDGKPIMGDRVRIYFGEVTPIEPVDQHLHAPKSQKQFFISPPPSPPFGWEVRDEAAPNKEVHAEDLAAALGKLHARPGAETMGDGDKDGTAMEDTKAMNRQRSGSTTVVYHPEDHGDNPHLPAVMIQDTTQDVESDSLDEPDSAPKVLTHTARPPVELM